MCKAAGKMFADYKRLSGTNDFLEELSSDMGIPISELIMILLACITRCIPHVRQGRAGYALVVNN